jgi:hypothetical protein
VVANAAKPPYTNLIADGDGQRTQVGSGPLDYVLRYAAGDYDCYYQGRYIGSRATLTQAIEAVQYEQAKAARQRQPSAIEDNTIAAECDELRAIAARLQDQGRRLAVRPAERVLTNTHLTMARIRVSAALRSLQDAERSLTLAAHAVDMAVPLGAA